jgi:hypothetical protein
MNKIFKKILDELEEIKGKFHIVPHDNKDAIVAEQLSQMLNYYMQNGELLDD